MNIPLLSRLFTSKARDEPQKEIKNYYYSGSDGTYLFGTTTSGENVNEFTAMQTTAVYACVRILAESMAALPLHLYRYTNEGKEKATDHPLYHLIHDEPNPEMTSFVWRETMMTHLLLWGNAYCQIIRDGYGKVLALYPLLPNRMSVKRDSVTGEIYYTYTKYDDTNPNFPNRITYRLSKDDVFHVPGLGFDGLIGYSPIAVARNAVGMTIASDRYGASFFKNGAQPSGVLEHPGILKDPQKVRDAWNAAYGGASNSHKTAVLEEGMTYRQISINPKDAQFLEIRKFQLNEIARLYRVPPHMVGDLEKSSFSNIEQQSLEFVTYTLNPWCVRIEQAIAKDLLLPSEKSRYFSKFNVDGLLRGDYQSRMNGYAIARQNGWMSTNDIREKEDMNLVPDEEGGNLYLINGNMTKLKDAGIFGTGGGQRTEEGET